MSLEAAIEEERQEILKLLSGDTESSQRHPRSASTGSGAISPTFYKKSKSLLIDDIDDDISNKNTVKSNKSIYPASAATSPTRYASQSAVTTPTITTSKSKNNSFSKSSNLSQLKPVKSAPAISISKPTSVSKLKKDPANNDTTPSSSSSKGLFSFSSLWKRRASTKSVNNQPSSTSSSISPHRPPSLIIEPPKSSSPSPTSSASVSPALLSQKQREKQPQVSQNKPLPSPKTTSSSYAPQRRPRSKSPTPTSGYSYSSGMPLLTPVPSTPAVFYKSSSTSNTLSPYKSNMNSLRPVNSYSSANSSRRQSFETDDLEGIDFSNAYRRLSDASLVKSGGLLAHYVKSSPSLHNSANSSTINLDSQDDNARLHKDKSSRKSAIKSSHHHSHHTRHRNEKNPESSSINGEENNENKKYAEVFSDDEDDDEDNERGKSRSKETNDLLSGESGNNSRNSSRSRGRSRDRSRTRRDGSRGSSSTRRSNDIYDDDNGRIAYDDTDEEFSTSSSEVEDSDSEDSESDGDEDGERDYSGLNTTMLLNASAPKPASSLLGALEDERKVVASSKYKFNSLLNDPHPNRAKKEVNIDGALSKKTHRIRPHSAFEATSSLSPKNLLSSSGTSSSTQSYNDDPNANIAAAKYLGRSPVPYTAEMEEINDWATARDLNVSFSPIVTSPESNRAIRTITRGNYAKYASQKGRAKRFLVPTDLSSATHYALEWTVGTVLRDGNSLYIIYAIDQDQQQQQKNHEKLKRGLLLTSSSSSSSLADSGAKNTSSDTVTSEDNERSKSQEKAQKEKEENMKKALKAEAERISFIEAITEDIVALLKRTRLQVRIITEVVHCSNAKYFVSDMISFLDPTLVIVGSRGLTHIKGVLLGSFSNYLIKNSPVPVMVVRKKLYKPKQKSSSKVRMANNLSLKLAPNKPISPLV